MSDIAQQRALTEAAVAGDTVALEQLLLGHFTPLEQYLRPRIPPDVQRYLGPDDILQETLSQAFRDIKHFQYRDEGSFFAWLRAISDHRLSDAVRKLGRKKRGGNQLRLSTTDVAKTSSFASLIDLVGYDSHLPEDSVQRHEVEKAIHVALASLPEIQREVLQDHFINGTGIQQIAAQTGKSEAAIRGLIRRGKEGLAEAMGRSSRWCP